MKKSEKTIRVKLNIPTQVISKIMSSNLNRFEQGKYLLLAQYYYNNSDVMVDASTLNKYLGIKDSKGKEIRLHMLNMGIIVSTEKASYAKGSNGQFYRRGYDMYQGTYQTKKIDYVLLSSDARALIGKYGFELSELLNVLRLPATDKDITKYEENKIKYTTNEQAKITGDLLEIIEQQSMNEITENKEGDSMAVGHVNNEESDKTIEQIMANIAKTGLDIPTNDTPLIADAEEVNKVDFNILPKPANAIIKDDNDFDPTVVWGDTSMSLEEALKDF